MSAKKPIGRRSDIIYARIKKGNFYHFLLAALALLWGVVSATSARADALTGFYTQVAEGDTDFDGGAVSRRPLAVGYTLVPGMINSQLGPDGLPVLSTAGINAGLGTSSDMNSTTHELLWWSAGDDPYVSLDQNPVRIDPMPLKSQTNLYTLLDNLYQNLVNFYPTGQTSDSSYFSTVNWQGTFTMASAGQIELTLQVDDDAWIFIDGILAAEDHYGYISDTSTNVSAGTHSIDVFYDDRFQGLDQIVLTSSVPLSPVPEPATLLLLSLGIPALVKFRRRAV
ncbi:MAG: PEP-CTERM sorting domain-containing protein [Sedimentisphaerales bacterium]